MRVGPETLISLHSSREEKKAEMARILSLQWARRGKNCFPLSCANIRGTQAVEERKGAFLLGRLDFIPTEEYHPEDAQEAIEGANFIVGVARRVIR